ncbi:MAG: hypothetical protein ACE5D4_07630 [Thermodesulfobacteriota bacterium]
MGRTELLQEVRIMRFEEIYGMCGMSSLEMNLPISHPMLPFCPKMVGKGSGCSS